MPVHPFLLPVVVEQMAAGRPLVFEAERRKGGGLKAIDTQKTNREFQRLLGPLGLPTGRKNGFTLHSLRRSFETHAVNSQIPQQVVDLWLGHASDRSMGAVYYTLHDAESQRFMARLNFGFTTPAPEVPKN